MYSLNTLRKINADRCAAPAREDELTRHASHCVSVKDGVRSVVLHSAKHRNTAFTKQDALIEAYYNGVPTGKQVVV